MRNADLVGEHPGRRLDHPVLGGDRRHLDHGVAEAAAEHAQAAVGRERRRRPGAARRALPVAGAVAPDQRAAVVERRHLPVARQPGAGQGQHVLVQQPGVDQRADQERRAAGGVEVVHVGGAVGVHAGPAAGRPRDRSSKSSHVSCTPAAAAIVTRCMVWLVEPPVASSADHAVDDDLLVDDVTDAVGVVAEAISADRGGRRPRSARSRSGLSGVDERGAGQVQAHHVHQQLVGVGGAVEGAGAGRVVRRHLGGQQVLAADLARRRARAGPRPSRRWAGPEAIGPAGTSAVGRWPNASAPATRPGTILSQTPSISAASNASWERAIAADIAMTSRLNRLKLHARPALGDPVAHGRARRPRPGRPHRFSGRSP